MYFISLLIWLMQPIGTERLWDKLSRRPMSIVGRFKAWPVTWNLFVGL